MGYRPHAFGGAVQRPLADAQRYIKNYFARLTGVNRFIETTLAEARRQGYVATLLQRRRYLPSILARAVAKHCEQMFSNFHGTLCRARRLGPLAREGHECFGVTPCALKSREAAAPEATPEEGAELLLEERRESGGIGAGGVGEKGFQIFAHHLMEDGAFGLAGRVPQGRNGRRTMLAGCGFVSHDDVMTVAEGDGIAANR